MTQVEPSSPPVAGAAPGDSLADGAAGIALLHIERARAGDTTWYNAQVWASAVTRGPVTAHPDIAGLYRGVPAVAFTLHAAGLPCYAPALDTLDGHIATLTRHRLARAHQRIDSGLLPALREYDLISGLTGIGAYLLHRGRDIELLGDVLIYLVRLTEPVLADGDMLPGWWCRDSPADQPADRWSGGHGNLGIAHGIAGPLALLSTATRRGVSVPGQTEAIERILAWLERWCVGTGRQSWWPGRITAAEQRSGTTAQRGRNGRLGATARRAWCAPGNSPRWP